MKRLCFPVRVTAVPEVSENQAVFFVGGQNSITLPRPCGGSHFTRFENLVGT
jgi:hypothetical protein